MAIDDVTLKAELTALKTQLADAVHRLAKAEGTIEQLNRSIASGNRMTNWQFVGFVTVMAGTLFGSMYWATGIMERRIDQVERRIDQVERHIDQAEKNLTTLVQQSERNMNARFEDLRQVVLAQQKR